MQLNFLKIFSIYFKYYKIKVINNIFLSKYNFLFFLILIIVHILFLPFKGTKLDLYEMSIREVKNQWEKGLLKNTNNKKIFNVNDYLTLDQFNLRGNNLWVNLLFYQKYQENLNNFFKKNYVEEFPIPYYPVFSHIYRIFFNNHIVPPSNVVKIASFLRSKLGAGILIRTKDKKIHSFSGKLNRKEFISFLQDIQKKLLRLFQLKLHLYKEEPYSKNDTSKVISLSTSYLNFMNFLSDSNITNQKLSRMILSYNREISDQFKYLKRKFSKINSSKVNLYSEYFISFKDEDELIDMDQDKRKFFEKQRKKIARVYTFKVKGILNGKEFNKEWLIKMDNFPNYENLFHNDSFSNLYINKISIYESKILKYKSNSRKFVNSSYINQKLRNAFMLLEDDYFYFQFGGIDFFALIKAAYGYFLYDHKKGYATISEQIYEMYLGQTKKNAFEKLKQVLGAMYIYYFTPKKDNILDLYIQSIPGSFWRDHNYGVSGIIKNYLNKDSIDQLSLKEIAWVSRIGILPNLFGQRYIRYSFFKKSLNIKTEDILDNKKFQVLLKKNSFSLKVKEELLKHRKIYLNIYNRMRIALKNFLFGNLIIHPLINKRQFENILKEDINFNSSKIINEYQSYTDQSIKELQKYLGSWSMNIGLDVQVELDLKSQRLLDKELVKANDLVNKQKERMIRLGIEEEYDENKQYPLYGGSSILVKTSDIQTNEVVNKIIAISSYHPNQKNEYFNWAVKGNRHFGSIFKWIILSLYLDQGGTLLDKFYDIPRRYKYITQRKKDKKDEVVYDYYYPDNWKLSKESPFGYYTYRKENNLINFIKSKNNTFVKIAQMVGLKKLSNMLNELAGLDEKNISDQLKFDPIYPIALGSQEITAIRFAQINSIISNKGIFQPLTTIYGIRLYNNFLKFDLKKYQRKIISREAAEAAFFSGYISTFLGTAKKFIKGGVGKTGSSPTDLSFLAMTARTKDQFIQDDVDHILNHNLLYLVNIGVNEGIHAIQGLYGGNTVIFNAKRVFRMILKNFNEQDSDKYKISGDFKKYFSKKFKYVPINLRIMDQKVKIPIVKNKEIKDQEEYFIEELKEIQNYYLEYIEKKLLKKQYQIEKKFENTLNKEYVLENEGNKELDLYQLNDFEKVYKKIDLFYEYKMDEIEKLKEIYKNISEKEESKKIIELSNEENQNKVFMERKEESIRKRIKMENMIQVFKERILNEKKMKLFKNDQKNIIYGESQQDQSQLGESQQNKKNHKLIEKIIDTERKNIGER